MTPPSSYRYVLYVLFGSQKTRTSRPLKLPIWLARKDAIFAETNDLSLEERSLTTTV